MPGGLNEKSEPRRRSRVHTTAAASSTALPCVQLVKLLLQSVGISHPVSLRVKYSIVSEMTFTMSMNIPSSDILY